MDIDELLKEAKTEVQLLAQVRPKVIDTASFNTTSRLPYKLFAFRESLLWRTESFARNAYELFVHRDIGPAVLLTRAVAENGAANWYLMETLLNTSEDTNFDELNHTINRLLIGTRTGDSMPKAVNVLTMLKKASKTFPKFYNCYEALSEYAHPNWSGTVGLYSEIDFEKDVTLFGQSDVSIKKGSLVGLNSLVASVGLYMHSYNKTADYLEKFIAVCESNIHKSG